MSKFPTICRSWRFGLCPYLVLVALSTAGCGGSLPAVASPEQARVTLQDALDAWRKGETVQSLQARVPAIHVNDPDWSSNKKLVQYKISSEEGHGNSWSCKVMLTLQDGAAKRIQKQANYTIDTDPKLVVVRDLFE